MLENINANRAGPLVRAAPAERLEGSYGKGRSLRVRCDGLVFDLALQVSWHAL
jgi:hypothetical protein